MYPQACSIGSCMHPGCVTIGGYADEVSVQVRLRMGIRVSKRAQTMRVRVEMRATGRKGVRKRVMPGSSRPQCARNSR